MKTFQTPALVRKYALKMYDWFIIPDRVLPRLLSSIFLSLSIIVFSQTTGLFYCCFDQPYNELVHTFHLARDSTSTPDRSESSLFRPTSSSTSASSARSSRRSSKSPVERSTLSNYIRLFEPMVIRALKHYTITSNVEQQSQVLQLLIQLVHLRVNYCLLDSDKIFVTYVLKVCTMKRLF